MRRLYVGGLSHSITQKDLKDRFGKFGDVEDVELRTRKDDDGVPFKTFGYININISDADLKRCMTVLNKTKWKGGTLQIETAKESFLHRLAQERQAVGEQHLQQPAAEDKRQQLMDSMSKAGVNNFTMKAAVPGTEIPGHKDWVVSKFGRVLPVLQLKCRKGNRVRMLKYDPSKYSHNIRRLDPSTGDQPTPVSKLTWEMQGGDDDISKKRRGEFPPYEPPRPKKNRKNVVNFQNAVGTARFVQVVDNTEAHQLTSPVELLTNHRLAQTRRSYSRDSDIDSDEEIRRLVEAQQTSSLLWQEDMQEDNLEVVGQEFLVKSERHHQQQKGRPGDKDEQDYDSADTDELFASRKPKSAAGDLSGNETHRKKKNAKRKSKAGPEGEEECDSTDAKERLSSRTPSSAQPRQDPGKQRSEKQGNSSENQRRKMTVLSAVKSSSSESDGNDEESDAADSDSDYEALFSNVTRLEISLDDLQKLAEESPQTSKSAAPSMLGTEQEQNSKLTSDPSERKRAPKKGTTPEEILAAIMAEESSEDERKNKKKGKKRVVAKRLPAFQGINVLNEGPEESECQHRAKEEEASGNVVKKQKPDAEAPQLNHRAADGISRKMPGAGMMPMSSGEEEEESKEEKKSDIMKSGAVPKALKIVPVNSKRAETDSNSGGDEENDDNGQVNDSPRPASHSESSSSMEEEELEEKKQGPPQMQLGAEEEQERQRKANMRRLAAVQKKQKEAEEHKKLIQGALANLDTPKARTGKHIVFGSDDDDDDDEEDEEDEQPAAPQVTASKKTLCQDSQSEDEAVDDKTAVNDNVSTKEKVCKSSGPQLFSSSEDEGDQDEEEEDDDSRFDIRPQFEGRAGQKLMALQSRFGTDERFRMDARFLEEEEDKEESERKMSMTEDEEALEEERKKNLSIMQSVLGSSQQTSRSSMTVSKAKTFRDVSTLHYDPSREEHIVFETKTDETKKESKNARRKKREEAQKLPEVSKEMFFDVSGDLKALFGQTTEDKIEGEQKTSWDQEEEEEEGGNVEEELQLPSLLLTDPNAEREESSGFKFSFFGNDTETGSAETEYKVESIEAPKVSWQQDPHLQDSSSEEDQEDQEDENISTAPKTTEAETLSKKDLFFFYPDDNRLTEGPRFFCRSSQLEEQREEWEERRGALRQEYRKKHKDARRKLNSSQKSSG